MISLVLTAWDRAHQLDRTLQSIAAQQLGEPVEVIVVEDGDDGGLTRAVCRSRPHLVTYIQRKRRPELRYSNPAVPINLGLRAATGDVIILQNAECLHVGADAIARLVAPVRENRKLVSFAQVAALDPNGRFLAWYCHNDYSPRAFFFCGAASRECFYGLRGMEESFSGYGYDDTLFGYFLTMNGYQFLFTDIRVDHQWHTQTGCPGLESNREHFEEIVFKVMSGERPPVSNIDRQDWGVQERFATGE